MLDFLKAVVLGLIQGLTEFLPISSSAHLRILPEWFRWGDPGAAFTAVIQIGTELAVLIYFRKDIVRIVNGWVRSLYDPAWRGHEDARMGWYVIVGSLPIVVLGVLLKDVIEEDFRSLWIIGTTLIVLGLILLLAERTGKRERDLDDLSARDGVIIGFAQALALVPGVSRSGATLTAGLFLNLERAVAARYSFLLSVPAVVLSGLFELKDIGGEGGAGFGPTALATLLAFVSGYMAIAFMLRFLQTNSTVVFVVYRVVLGTLVLSLVAAGAIS